MIYLDSVYGEQKIEEEILIELINSSEMQRLKKISQFGMPDEYYYKKGFSRYEHSMGVFFLVKKLGGNLKEQIVGLLHDVSHTAFSHVVDWVIGDPNEQDYQDNRHLDFIRNSSLTGILEKYDLFVEEIADLHSFHLVDYPAPDLCADRIDYTLREMALEEDLKDINRILDSLEVYNGRIIFNNMDSAFIFSNYYAKFNREHWAGNEAKIRYHILAGILKIALSEKILSIEEIEGKDDYDILSLLEKCKNDLIIEDLNLLKKGFKINKSSGKDSFFLKGKFRFVNPMVLHNEKIARLSEINEDYKKILDLDKEEFSREEKITLLT
ncbi:MAG: HD domain-containing protein [Nanoarchaeota archaeon]